MKKLVSAIMVSCLAFVASCGGHFSSDAERKAFEDGKTTLFYEREDATQTTRLLHGESVQSMLLVFTNGSKMRGLLSTWGCTKHKSDGAVKINLRNFDGRAEVQTFYAKRLDLSQMIEMDNPHQIGLEGGYLRYQSNLSPSFIEQSQRGGKVFLLGEEEVTAEEVRKGVRIDLKVVDGRLKTDVKR